MAKDLQNADLGTLRVLPNDDLSNDFDPTTSEHADTDMAELERIVDAEYGDGDSTEAAPSSDDDDGTDVLSSTGTDGEATDEAATADEADESDDGEKVVEDAAAQESPEDQRISALQRQIELQALGSEKTQADLEKFKLLADRNAGQAGSLLQQLERLQQSRPVDDSAHERGYDDDDAAAAPRRGTAEVPSEFKSELEEIRAERATRVITGALQDFMQSPSVTGFTAQLKATDGDDAEAAFNTDFNQRIMNSIQEDPGTLEVLRSSNAKVSARLLTSVVKSAFADARIAHLHRQDETARALIARQREQAKGAKQDTGSSGSSKSSSSSRKPADPTKMKMEDLERLIDKQYGVTK